MSSNASTVRAQAASLATAVRHGEGYTSADLELITAFTDDVTDRELAVALGRSVYAIQAIQAAIREGKPVGSTRKPAPAYRGWTEDMGDE
jgi:hypothetical protein